MTDPRLPNAANPRLLVRTVRSSSRAEDFILGIAVGIFIICAFALPFITQALR